jgi:Coenzyme PQQ synthesis protein D (PqqD)
VELRELAPVRTAAWREVDGRVVVERSPVPAHGWRRLVDTLFFLTGVERIRLDALGSSVWRRLDGAATVGEVCAGLRAEFGAGCEPVEDRLGSFLATLRRGKLIAYPGFDDADIARWRERAPDTTGAGSV